jgi:uncharacterized delta-60 repeat protein
MLLSASSLASDAVHEAWVARYDGPTHEDDQAWDIAVDSEGCVYVVGSSEVVDGESDALTIKYDADGQELWLARYDGPSGGKDYGYALALCPDGDIVVAGSSRDTVDDFDLVTIRYDSDGLEEWVATYDGPGSGEGFAYDIACDTLGGIYVTGYCWGGQSQEDAVTIKYAPDGTELWVSRYEGPVSGWDSGYKMALGSDGSVYVVGRSMGGYTSYDVLTIKYDSDGNEQWVRRYDGEISHDDRGFCIAADDRGGVCVGGVCFGGWSPGTQWDYVTIRYDEDGNEEWVAIYDGPASGYDIAYGIGFDPEGNVCVTGGSAESGTDITNFDYDYVTVKYDSLGTQLWLDRYSGESDGHDTAHDLVIDPSGNVYVTGSSDGPDGIRIDYATVRYSPAGDIDWVMRYNGPLDGSDYANALTLDEDANIYVTGGSNNAWDDRDMATVKYVQEAADTAELPLLSLSMPNPCRGDAFFGVSVPAPGARAVVQVFDVQGRIVRTLLDGFLSGSTDVHWDGRDAIGHRAASGVYFVLFRAGEHRTTRKIVVLR